MAQSYVKTENHLRGVMNALERKIQAELNAIAVDGQREVRDDLKTHRDNMGTDTGASEASVYTVRGGPGGERSGYSEAVSRMADLYTTRYSVEHWQERVMPPYHLPVERASDYSAVSSCSKVMAFWEWGHYNRWLGAVVWAPHFRPLTLIYSHGTENVARRFHGILKRSYHTGS